MHVSCGKCGIEDLLELVYKINIVHWDRDFILPIGFYPKSNNKFVYKYYSNIKRNIFECQMIDSDVF